jgi:uncharacterized protein (TIGR00296 family)
MHLGTHAVKLAREAVEAWTREGKTLAPKEMLQQLREKRGVFVTIHTYPERQLRGCIGYPEPLFRLGEAIIQSAVHACRDPRFEPLREDELGRIILEVSVLTKPFKLKQKPDEYGNLIELGRDGLIVERGPNSGLLLPQVATEHGMDMHEFLSSTCLKAGLPPAAWMEQATKVYTFQAEIFSETEPNGEVTRQGQ